MALGAPTLRGPLRRRCTKPALTRVNLTPKSRIRCSDRSKGFTQSMSASSCSFLRFAHVTFLIAANHFSLRYASAAPAPA